VAGIVATHKTIARSDTAVTSIATFAIIHDNSVTWSDRTRAGALRIPARIFTGLEIAPKHGAGTFIAIRGTTMDHRVYKQMHLVNNEDSKYI
jgi:hypothetical protein